LANDKMIVAYLIASALAKRDGAESSEVDWFAEKYVFDSPLAKFRDFVQAVDNNSGGSETVQIPAGVAKDFAERFRWFVNYIDDGGKDYDLLLTVLGVRERGRFQTSRTKRKQLGLAMLMAWVIHIGMVNGVSISPNEAANKIEALAENVFPKLNLDVTGYRHSNLMDVWKLFKNPTSEAVRVIAGTGGLGQILGPDEWPHLAKEAASENY